MYCIEVVVVMQIGRGERRGRGGRGRARQLLADAWGLVVCRRQHPAVLWPLTRARSGPSPRSNDHHCSPSAGRQTAVETCGSAWGRVAGMRPSCFAMTLCASSVVGGGVGCFWRGNNPWGQRTVFTDSRKQTQQLLLSTFTRSGQPRLSPPLITLHIYFLEP